MKDKIVITVLLLLLTSECQSTPCFIAPLSTTCELVVDTMRESITNAYIVLIKTEVEFDTVVDFVSRAFSDQRQHEGAHSCNEVIGIVGGLDAKTASIVHTLSSRANLNVTLVSAVAPSSISLPTTNLALPNLLDMNPLTHYLDALVAFCDQLEWTRVGLISDDNHFYTFAAELLQQKLLVNAERTITPFVRISERDNTRKTIQTFKKYETDVIIISTSDEVACSLIQEAGKAGFVWPQYAWILLDISFNPLPGACLEEGVILFTDQRDEEGSSDYHVSGACRELENFVNSSVFLDSVLAAAIAAGKSLSNGSFPGVNGTVKFRDGKRLTDIVVTQIDSSRIRKEIGLYEAQSQHLSIDSSFLAASNKPRGTILIRNIRDVNLEVHQTLVMLVFVFSFIFITTVFILYVYFRKEKEIKATSVTISMCMFLGCYILVFYLPLLLFSENSFSCHLLAWLSITGIPFLLIMATLFAKMLRVYLIFSDPISYKKKFFSDRFLLLYIVLFVSPNFLVLMIWSSSDPLTLTFIEKPHQNTPLILSRCTSEHIIKWVAVLLFYIIVFSFALVCLAFKTSKIRYRYFSDTKATNAFTYLTTLAATLTLVFWYYYYQLGLSVFSAAHIARGALYAGHSGLAILCQVFLFVPKVYPPLERKFTQDHVMAK